MVLGELGTRDRLQAALPAGLTPLVGRGQELALLLARWEQVTEGRGQVVLLNGEAGIGKSRLVYTLREQLVNEPHTWLECHCSAYHQNSALYPVVELLQQKEGDTQLVNAIRAVANDGNPEHRELVENLDSVLQGIEKSVEKGETTPEAAADETKLAIAQTQEALQDVASDQQAELLLMKADLLAEKYFDALPPEYTDEDKEVISTLLTDAVNWEAIEEDPNVLQDAIPQAFEEVLQFFGEPRGEAVQATEGETKQTTAPVTAPVEEEVPEHLKTDWGELKEIQTPKGEVLKPIHSDEDFEKALANELKRINR